MFMCVSYVFPAEVDGKPFLFERHFDDVNPENENLKI